MSLAYDRSGSGPAAAADPRPRRRAPHLGAGARRLADDHDVIRVDLPGFGDSPVLPIRARSRAGAPRSRDRGPARRARSGRARGRGQLPRRLGRARARRPRRALSVTGIAPAGLWAGPLRPQAVRDAQPRPAGSGRRWRCSSPTPACASSPSPARSHTPSASRVRGAAAGRAPTPGRPGSSTRPTPMRDGRFTGRRPRSTSR